MSKQTKARRLSLLWGAYLLLVALAGLLMWQRLAQIQKQSAIPVGGGNGTAIEQPQQTGETAVTVTFIDVGQGDSTLITTANHAILIDGGEYSAASAVKAALHTAGVKQLDAVILTHPHSDHFGSLRSILEEFPVGEFIMPEVPQEQLPTAASYGKLIDTLQSGEIPCRYAVPGMSWELEGATLTVLGPAQGKTYDGLNDYSVVTRLTCGETAFLFTGDAEEPSEYDLLASGEDLSADVLKVGHHGSGTSSSIPFLQRVQPDYAVIPVGADNDYNLPSDDALRRLKLEGATLYRTDLQGCVTVKSDGAVLTITTEE